MNTVLGLDRIGIEKTLFDGKRIGLITNFSGVGAAFEDNLTAFARHGYKVVKLFTPEHGLYGFADGQPVHDSVHQPSGLPICSLYGERKAPRDCDLDGIDMLVYDIQDVGLRYFTFIYTLAYCMEAAAKKGIGLTVLDRPNPLGGEIISGSRIAPEFDSFVGAHALPIRYGLTAGEFGAYYKKLKKLDLDYSVVKMLVYTSSTYFPDTGLIWNVPSPALPTFDSTLCYCGGCFFESTNISEGRGSPKPFQMYGAPFVDMDALYESMIEQIPQGNGVAFRKRAFVPFTSKHKDQVCYGLEFEPTDKRLDFIPVAITLMREIKRLHPEHFSYVKYADVDRIHNLTGDPNVLECVEQRLELSDLLKSWEQSRKEFIDFSQDIKIY